MGLVTVIVNVPFAAVFPSTPAMLTCWPVLVAVRLGGRDGDG